MNKKIAYINFSGGWGGLEIFSLNIFKWMTQEGYEIIFFVEEKSKLHQNLINIFPENKNIIPLKTIKYIDVANIIKIRDILIKKKIEIVHTFKSSDIWFSVLASKLFTENKNFIKTIHHLQMLPTKPRKGFFHKIIYGHLDLLISISEQMRLTVYEKWPVNKKIVKTIYHGVDTAKFKINDETEKNVIKLKYKIPLNKTIIGIAGQIIEGKGQHIVLEAFNKIADNYKDIILIITGNPPPGEEAYLEKLKKFVAENNLLDRVVFTGYSSEIQKIMSVIDIFVLGSKEETFGLVVIEAMASGSLVIASNSGGVPEIIKEGDNGFLYEPFNSEDLKKQLVKALTITESDKTKLLKSSLATVESKFSLSCFIENIKQIYSN